MKTLVGSFVAVCLLFAVAGRVPAQKTAGHRVVIQVNVEGTEAWNGLLNNIENLQKAFGPTELQIEPVSLGKGLDLLLKTNVALKQRLEQAAANGVVFAACQNTMRMKHVTKSDLFSFAITVDSGAAEIVRKQEAGWSYFKAGE